MIEIVPFCEAFGVLALQLQKPAGAALQKAYWEGLKGETDQPEWEAFCAVAARRWGASWGGFIPTVPQLFDALLEFRGAPSLLPESVAAYERVVAAGEYSAEGGTSWTFRRVLEQCGRAAAEAFQAAGGHSAFATTWDEAKRRATFLEHYQLAARQDPQTRQLPAPEVKVITGEVEASGPVDSAAAGQAMRDIRERLEVVPVAAPTNVHKPRHVIATDERLATLRRQAQEITEEPAHAGDEEA